MGNFLKNAVVIVGVLVISTGIFLLVSRDQALRGDVLDRSLKALGNQLISMIPEDTEQENVKGKWDVFADKARRGELSPEKVERVAVGILNASNSEGRLSAEDAKVMLNLAMESGETKSTSWEWETTDQPSKQAPRAGAPKKTSLKHGKRTWTDLGKELAAACDFNQRIKETCEDDKKRQVLVKRIRYNYDDGIKISADMQIKNELEKAEFASLGKELSLLAHQDMVHWSHDLAMELDRQRVELKMQLDSLKVSVRSGKVRLNDELAYVFQHRKELEALKTLEKLHHLEAVSPEYVKKMVRENLDKHIKVETK